MVGWAYAEAAMRPHPRGRLSRAAAESRPDNAENWSSLGESLQTASATLVPEGDRGAGKGVRLNPADPRARYFLAVPEGLARRSSRRPGDWLALLKDTPARRAWRGDLLRTINQTASQQEIDVEHQLARATTAPAATGAIPGPSRGAACGRIVDPAGASRTRWRAAWSSGWPRVSRPIRVMPTAGFG
jgi:cytochrome c-type biogenesis protein CcmH